GDLDLEGGRLPDRLVVLHGEMRHRIDLLVDVLGMGNGDRRLELPSRLCDHESHRCTAVDTGGHGFCPLCLSSGRRVGVDRIVGRFRCSIAGMMAAVALIALDCRAIGTPLSGLSVTECMLVLGGLPMANILAGGLLILLADRSWRRVHHPWL